MQILPESFENTSSFSVSQPGAKKTIAQSGPFAGLLNRLAGKADASGSKTPSTGKAEAVELKQEDLVRLKARLRQQGMSEEDIADIQARVEASGTMTWKGFIDQVSQKMGFAADDLPTSFDAEARKELLGLLGKLGYTPQQSSDIVAELAQGKNGKVWEKITSRTSRLDQNDLEAITRSELLALAAAMNVSQAGMKRLDELLGAGQEQGLTANGVNAALSTILTEAVKARKGLESNLSQLKSDLSRGLQEAVNRGEIAGLADNKESKDAQAAKVLIEDAAEKGRNNGASRNTTGITQVAQHAARQQAGATKKGMPDGEQAAEGTPAQNGNTDKAVHPGAAKNAARAAAVKAAAEGANTGKDGAGLADAEPRSARDELKARVETKPFARDELAGFNRLINPAADRPAQTTMQSETPLASSAGLTPQKLMQTIETGAFTNLGEGKRQLTLTLEPETLGKLNIVLQIHNKEVTAVIRTENQDVTKMLADNMHLLRQNLEQQGLKVDKLDVQTQLSNEHAFRDWQGTQQHNQAQEQETRQRVLSSMRLLRGAGEEQADLAQDMQYTGQREKSSLSAVDLFA